MSGLIGAAIGSYSSFTGGIGPGLGGVFGTYGDATFTVVGSPTHYERTDKFYFAKIDVINAKPNLQWLWDELIDIKLTVMLHYIWCRPADVLMKLHASAQTHQPAPFSIGSLFIGNFLTQSLEQKDTWRADDGTLLVATLSLTLLEFAGQLPASGPTQPNYFGNNAQSSPGAVLAQSPGPSSVGPGQNYSAVDLQTATRLGPI